MPLPCRFATPLPISPISKAPTISDTLRSSRDSWLTIKIACNLSQTRLQGRLKTTVSPLSRLPLLRRWSLAALATRAPQIGVCSTESSNGCVSGSGCLPRCGVDQRAWCCTGWDWSPLTTASWQNHSGVAERVTAVTRCREHARL